MNVALFTESFLPGCGGTENAVLKTAYELVNKGHKVAVFAPDYHRANNDKDYPFLVIRCKSIKITESDQFALPSLDKKVKKALKEFAPDVIHANTTGMMAGYGLKYGKKHNIATLCTAHMPYKRSWQQTINFPPIIWWVMHRIIKRLRLADQVCTVSNFMVKELQSYGYKKQLAVVKNGNTDNTFEEKAYTPNGKFTLTYVGRIVKYKNLDFVLEVVKELTKTTKNFVLRMVGDGPDFKKYNARCKKMGIQNYVEFVGRITDREKLGEEYKKADIFFFPSVIDSDGLGLLEAATKGTPSLVVENTGPSERITNNKTGFTAENNVKAFAEKVLWLMQNPKIVEEVGKNSKQICTTWENNVEEYVKLYLETIKKVKEK